MLLEIVAYCEISKLGGSVIPAHRVAARPVSVRHCPDLNRHADTVPHVKSTASYLGELPSRPQVTGSPLGVRLESSTSEDYGTTSDFGESGIVFGSNACHPFAIVQKRNCSRAIANLHTFP